MGVEDQNRRIELAIAAGRLFSLLGIGDVFECIFPVLGSVTEFANPYHDDKGRFTTGPEEESDLATKKGINIGDHISFVPQGKSSTVVVKVVGKDRGKGSGINGQRVVDGVVKPGVNHYEVPTGVKVVKPAGSVAAKPKLNEPRSAFIKRTAAPAPAPVGPTAAQKISNAARMYGTGSAQHLAAINRFGTSEQKAAAAKAASPTPVAVPTAGTGAKILIPGINTAARGRPPLPGSPAAQERITNTITMYGKGSPEHQAALSKFGTPLQQRMGGMQERIAAKTAEQVARIKAQQAEYAAQVARNAIKAPGGVVEGEPGLAAAWEKVNTEVARRDAEIKGAVDQPSQVVKSLNWNGTMKMPSVVQQGVLNGADALEQAGLKGDFGKISVQNDRGGRSRNGAYAVGLNQIYMNSKLGTDDAAFTFTHEYFHHMDHFEATRQQSLAGRGIPGVVGNANAKDMSKDPEFQRLVKATPEWKNIQDGTRGSGPNAGFGRRYNAYLASWTEVFARAGAQWVTGRTGDSELKDVLNRRRSTHWSDENFKPIAAYMDRKMAREGSGYGQKSKSMAASASVEFGEGNPYHDERGRFTGPGSIAEKVVSTVESKGGATLEPGTGKDVEEGYAVGLGTTHPGTEFNAAAAEFSAADVKGWLKSAAVKELFKNNSSAKIGVWEDGGKIYLEPSEQVGSRADAVRLGKERNQIGIQHLVPASKGGEGYIDIGGTGE